MGQRLVGSILVIGTTKKKKWKKDWKYKGHTIVITIVTFVTFVLEEGF